MYSPLPKTGAPLNQGRLQTGARIRKKMVVFYTNYSRKPGRLFENRAEFGLYFSLQNYVFTNCEQLCIICRIGIQKIS